MGKSLIRRFFTAVLASLMITNLSASEKTLLMYGDSLSAAYGLTDINRGWVQLLQKKITQHQYPWKIINVSISGETTAGGLSRFRKTLATTKPDLVLLELGANDGLQGKPLKTLKSNLDQMIALAREYNSDIILFEMKIPPNYGPVYGQRFTETFHKLGKKWDVPVMPFFLNGVAGNDSLNQPDGIHPTETAQPILLNNVWPILKPMLKPY
ncbi:arylesterase [Endozoicomonas sp.]|uniref:arylesterase n=1 Tax=Endozoicomonas sp. TaxID=1892382 RepID=UPI002884A080|nr:arylesterase [Endozoicomonas sp.]